jgi:hypothetical protein
MDVDALIICLQRVRKYSGGDAEVYVGSRKSADGAWVVGSIETKQKDDSNGEAEEVEITINPARS